MKGLNWHVQVDPLSLSTTSLPDTFDAVAAVVDEAPDEVLDELPPQAASPKHTTANNINHLKRFIDSLHSRFGDCQLLAG
ncbi:MAG TPA: hypothetical protein VMG37_00105 [Solirubrobacteraceae bacterium]|nr:hypothetical protein [Solirubrobacteraceae bacterium]